MNYKAQLFKDIHDLWIYSLYSIDPISINHKAIFDINPKTISYSIIPTNPSNLNESENKINNYLSIDIIMNHAYYNICNQKIPVEEINEITIRTIESIFPNVAKFKTILEDEYVIYWINSICYYVNKLNNSNQRDSILNIIYVIIYNTCIQEDGEYDDISDIINNMNDHKCFNFEYEYDDIVELL